jgi:hypothetical protein
MWPYLDNGVRGASPPEKYSPFYSLFFCPGGTGSKITGSAYADFQDYQGTCLMQIRISFSLGYLLWYRADP